MSEMAYHIVGAGQYFGTCRYHLFKDCFHLHKKRTMGPMDMTGEIHTAELPEETTNVCKLCTKRKQQQPHQKGER